jgi:hypothetical protein
MATPISPQLRLALTITNKKLGTKKASRKSGGFKVH